MLINYRLSLIINDFEFIIWHLVMGNNRMEFMVCDRRIADIARVVIEFMGEGNK